MKLDRTHVLVALAVISGLVLRLLQAFQNALNPDEALIFFISEPANWLERGLAFHHPPLFFLLLHYIQLASDAEIALRLVPVLAGSLFPLVVFAWLRRWQFPDAGLIALLLLTFSPNLISLSAQVRGYTLVMLFAALALYFLDLALAGKSIRHLWISTVFLYLAILTEYSALFAVVALGTYALFQQLLQGSTARFRGLWVLTQLGGIVIYALLYFASIAGLVESPQRDELVAGYLRGGFPRPGENLALFAASATMKQFAFLLASIPVGAACAFLFGAGLVSLWFNRALRPWIALLVLPFIVALSASVAGLHPYGRTRHSVILGIFAAPGIGLGLSWLSSGLPRWRLPLALFLVLATYFCAAEEPQNVPAEGRPRLNLVEGIEKLKQRIPAGSIILADKETALLLKFYAGPRHSNLDPILNSSLHREALSGMEVYFDGWDHRSMSRIQTIAARLRSEFEIPTGQPIWVVDGGFAHIETQVADAEFINQCLLVFPLSQLQPAQR